MFKFKKGTTSILLYCVIGIFVFLIFYSIYNNMYNIHESNPIESFSLRETFNSQKRKFKNFKNRNIKQYKSKLNRFFKSIF
jgi:uncharacterized membrane protein YfhO